MSNAKRFLVLAALLSVCACDEPCPELAEDEVSGYAVCERRTFWACHTADVYGLIPDVYSSFEACEDVALEHCPYTDDKYRISRTMPDVWDEIDWCNDLVASGEVSNYVDLPEVCKVQP